MKKNMKKILALLLTASMTLGMTFTASATEANQQNTEEQQDTESVVSDESAEKQDSDSGAAEQVVSEEPTEDSEAKAAVTTSTMGSKPADGTTMNQPFKAGTGGSQNFRIPAMVTLSDGTIVAATDARWDTTTDGYGLDTIVSRSTDGGATWNYTFANYLGDNGNVSNSNSTAFIDPALTVTADDTIYMLVDLYPAGGIISSISNGTGYNSAGKLMLSNGGSNYGYYLDNGKIYSNNGTEVSGLQVDDYFNLTGTYQNQSYDTNLFFNDSPFKVLKTSYLYLTKSTDGGATWSAPTMLNSQVKNSSDKFYGVGPGRGLTTRLDNGTERIIFPCYTYTSDDGNTSVIYSDDGGQTWTRSKNIPDQTSEATLTEVNGKIYMFTRHGGYYVSEDHGATWGSRQNVSGISYTTSCQMNAITYSKKIDGKDAILLSAGTNGRKNGKIFVGLVQGDGSINWEYNYPVNNGEYQYSCMSELNDGTVALLYENGSASEKFEKYSIEKITNGAKIAHAHVATSEGTSVTATISTENAGDTFEFSKCEKKAEATTVEGYNCSVTYDIELLLNGKNYTDSAELTVPYDESVFNGCTKFIGYVAKSASGKAQTFPVTVKNGKFVGICPHFSEVTIAGYKDDIPEGVDHVEDVSLGVNGTTSYTQEGEYSKEYSDDIVDAKAKVTNKELPPYYETATLKAGTFYASSKANDTSPATQITLEDAGNGQYYVKNANGEYIYPSASLGWDWSYALENGKQAVNVESNDDGSVCLEKSYREWFRSTTAYLNLSSNEFSCSGERSNIYLYNQVTPAPETQTKITFKGKQVGTTSVTIGTTMYRITVQERGGNDTASVKVGGSANISIPHTIGTDETVTWSSSDYAKAGVYSADGKNATLTGRKTGTTVVTATVKNNEGTVAATYTWNVTVIDGSAANTGGHTVTYTIDNTIYNGKLYYSVDGSELVEVPVASQTTDADGNTIYTYKTISVEQKNVAYSQMQIFVKPDDGYAVSTVSATKGDTYSQFYGIDKENLKVIYSDEHQGGRIEDCLTAEQEKALLAEAVEKGCDAVFWYSRGSEGSHLTENREATITHEIHCDKLPTVTKEIEYLKQGDDYKKYTEGMTANAGDTVVFKIVVSTYKESADINYSNALLKDIMPNVAGTVKLYSGVGESATALTNPYKITNEINHARTKEAKNYKAEDYTYYAVYELQDEDLEQLITNNVELSYAYSSTYSSGTYGGTAKANAQFFATAFEGINDIVVDYGSPVTTERTKAWGTGKFSITGAANHGVVKVDGDNTTGIQVTYTPTEVLTEADTVTLTNSKGGVYKFKVYPATTVYYEEGFGTYTNQQNGGSNKGTAAQTVSSVGSKAHYGYDSSYDNNTQDSDNSVVELAANGKGEFSFKGTGVELYARSTPDSGKIMAYLYKGTTLKKLYTINTKQAVGTSGLTSMQNKTAYSAPVLSIAGLDAGEYTIKFEVVKTTNDDGTKEIKPVYIDGYRVYSDTTYNEQYSQDDEANPTFTEMRNSVLAALDVDTTKGTYANQIAQGIASQVYDKTTGTGAVIVNNNKEVAGTAQDLLNNGPKNEIYLNPNQAVVFQFASGITTAQIGLKALQGNAAQYTISYEDGTSEDKTLNSSTDMFYKLDAKKGTITITNKAGSGVLAITKIKTFGEISSNAMFAELSADDFMPALLSLGYETEKPMADATANLNLVDYTGKTIASTSLTANGEQGTDATFTADQIKSAVTSALPEGYAVVDASKIADQTVKYGESADVNVQIGKVATLKVTYKKLFGKTVGTATLTGVQTSAGSKYSFSASEIKKAVPSGYWTIKLWGTKVKYGTTGTLTVNVF